MMFSRILICRCGLSVAIILLLSSFALAQDAKVPTQGTSGSQVSTRSASDDNEIPRPRWPEIQATINTYFHEKKNYRDADLITQQDVRNVLSRLEEKGWQVPEGEALIELALTEANAMFQVFQTQDGRKFMRQNSSQPQMFDRFDRITREWGGRELLAALVKLPDAYRYAKPSPKNEVLQFLPKDRSGKARKIKDFNKPTGRIYQAADLALRLNQLYVAQLAAESQASPGR